MSAGEPARWAGEPPRAALDAARLSADAEHLERRLLDIEQVGSRVWPHSKMMLARENRIAADRARERILEAEEIYRRAAAKTRRAEKRARAKGRA